MSPPRIRIGISACLLGQQVRYDGGHKRDAWIADGLGRLVEFVPVCPEVEAGLGVPRPPIRLVDAGGGAVRLVEPASGRDLTARMRRFAERRVRALADEDLCGFVLKARSPSCGPARVEVRGPRGGRPRLAGRGLFAEALLRRHPLLPVEEEGGLADPARRAHFLLRVHAFRRVRDLFRGRWTAAGLAAFHAREELLLLAHAPAARASLGRLVARAGRLPRARVAREYAAAFLAALARPPTGPPPGIPVDGGADPR